MIPACSTLAYTASSLVYSGRGLWFGYSVRNVHADTATLVTFHDGTSTSAPIIGVEEVPFGTAKVQFPNGASVKTESGLFVELSGGTPTCTPYYLTQTRLTNALALYDNDVQGVNPEGLLHLLTWLSDHGYELPDLTDVSPG